MRGLRTQSDPAHRVAGDALYRMHVGDGAAWVSGLPPASVEAIVLDLTEGGGPSSPLSTPAFYAPDLRAALRPQTD